ncbi:hypothetical protein DFH29DRAFT_879024 [Suillus ampliporus]|nr:hypothetical protein DFH29DRAFT_879024 [Suillus ampliporus]
MNWGKGCAQRSLCEWMDVVLLHWDPWTTINNFEVQVHRHYPNVNNTKYVVAYSWTQTLSHGSTFFTFSHPTQTKQADPISHLHRLQLCILGRVICAAMAHLTLLNNTWAFWGLGGWHGAHTDSPLNNTWAFWGLGGWYSAHTDSPLNNTWTFWGGLEGGIVPTLEPILTAVYRNFHIGIVHNKSAVQDHGGEGPSTPALY